MILDSWLALAWITTAGALAWLAAVYVRHLECEQRFSSREMFDLLVNVALGLALATALYSSELGPGVRLAVFAMLIGLRLAITRLSGR